MLLIDDIALRKIEVKGFVDFLATDESFVWSTNQDLIQKWSSDTFELISEIPVPKAAGIPVYAFGSIWAASLQEHSIYRIDAQTNQILSVIQTGVADQTGEFSLAATKDGIWLMGEEGKLIEIDPTNNQIRHQIEVLPYSYNLRYSADALWLSNTKNSSIQRIDPALKRVSHTIQVDDKPWFIASNEDYIWSLNQTYGTVSKICTQNCEVVATIQLPALACGDGGDIFATQHRVWVRTTNLLLIEIDASSNEILREIHHDTPAGSGAVIQSSDHLWITAHDIETLWILKV